ncbi:unnamed protein product [Mesocestoides corti]|uniref:Ubiquitin-like domain-containing protein n=1 Tax=Mesocestoides corti TaxID=53468 RepID=A0A0R3U915_MESCO|nr:unnamed protein product [Mesocestoides corti]
MQVRIVHKGSDLLTVNVDAETTVSQVKEAITQAIKVRPKDQILTSKGIFLEDTHTLGKYGVYDWGSLELHLRLNSQKIIPVRVALSPTEVVTIPIRSDATVDELRLEISKRTTREHFKVSSAILVYSHWVLENGHRLEEYGVNENDCITVAEALARGTPPAVDSNESYDYCEGFQGMRIEGDARTQPAPPPPPPQQLPPQAVRRKSYQTVEPTCLQVHFLSNDGDPLTLPIPRTQTLKSVCSYVQKATGIPVENQEFIISGEAVDPELTLLQLGIQNDDSIFLNDSRLRIPTLDQKKHATSTSLRAPAVKQKSFKDLEVNFDLGDGYITLVLPTNSTVDQAIRELRKALKPTNCRFELRFENRHLEPSRSLCEYGIHSGSVVNVVAVPEIQHYRANTGFL